MLDICSRLKNFLLLVQSVLKALKAMILRALRGVGFSTLVCIFSKGQEERKQLITHSRKIAFACCCVHILPAIVSGTILFFNFQRRFIGSQLEGQQNKDSVKLSVLQVCAKAQVLPSSPPICTRQILLDSLRRTEQENRNSQY